MKKISRIATILAAAAMTAVSCMHDTGLSNDEIAEGQPVMITMDPGLTRAGEDPELGDALDRAVTSLRVLIYDSRTGQLVWNFTPDELTAAGLVDGDEEGEQEIPLSILTGTYDFVFIGNERSGYAADPTLVNLLANEDNFDTMGELRQLTFGLSAFPICRELDGRTDLIPMVTFIPTVKVMGDNEINSPSTGHVVGTWNVALERAGIRIDIELTLTAEQYTNYLNSKLLLWDPARAAYLLPRSDNMEHDTDGDDNLNYNAADILSDVEDELGEDDEPTGRKIVSGSYLLPERILGAANNKEANAMTIELFNSGAQAKGSGKSSPIWYKDGSGDPTWSFPRNTRLKLAGTVLEDEIVFSDIMVIDWDGEEVPASPGVLGVNKRTGELTLVGSVHYKNTPVATNGPDATHEFGPISNDTVYVAYFKWGSLIGSGHQYNEDEIDNELLDRLNRVSELPYAEIVKLIDDNDNFDVTDIVWAPKKYDVKALMERIGPRDSLAAWNEVPYAEDNVWPADNPVAGLGDPCAYANKGIATGKYVMPTGNPWNGGTFGNTYAQQTLAQAHATYIPVNEVNSGIPIPGIHPGDGSGGHPIDWSMFLPAAGYRMDDGTAWEEGEWWGVGCYWTNTPFIGSSNASSYVMAFGKFGLTQYIRPTVMANAIRCVREPERIVFAFDYLTDPAKTVTVDADSWTATIDDDDKGWINISKKTGDSGESFDVSVNTNYAVRPGDPLFRTGTITVTAGGITTNIITVKEYALWGGHADIIYLGDDNNLQIGQWKDEITNIKQMLFFRFGGVIGMMAPKPGASWSTDKIVFNPSKYGTGSNDDGNTITNFGFSTSTVPAVPFYDITKDYTILNTSSPDYHKGENIRQGKGDPCKLVGFDIYDLYDPAFLELSEGEKAQALENWDSGWRLPTVRENISFVGGSDSYNKWRDLGMAAELGIERHYVLGNNTTDAWPYWRDNTDYPGNPVSGFSNSDTDPRTCRLPVCTDAFNVEWSQILPIAGFLDSVSGFFNQGAGFYCSSTPLIDGQPNCFGLQIYEASQTWLHPHIKGTIRFGYNSRCVREDQSPRWLDENKKLDENGYRLNP